MPTRLWPRVAAHVITPGVQWMGLLALVVGLFFWKILLTNQFSLLLEWETANQAYAWYHFATVTMRQGVVPLWDPFTFAGHSFVGEMQTGLFYPLKLVLYFWPLGEAGLLSPRLYHGLYVLAHWLGAGFMFLLAREVQLSPCAALVAALTFSLGGFVGQVVWPNMLDSAIWLPLICLFLLRAVRCASLGGSSLYACLSGLAFGMVMLAGSLHVAIMDVTAMVSAVLYLAWQTPPQGGGARRGCSPLGRSVLIVGLTGLVGAAAGAVQLLPSLEYSALALRWIGDATPVPATQKIPYAQLTESYPLLPRALLGFVFKGGFTGDPEVSNYLGILPLLLAIIGVWRHWQQAWVRYLTGLAVLAFFYSLGSFSLLHGLLYALVPFLDMAREAGRFIYLTHFAMALLAGFGVQTLFQAEALAHAPLAGLTACLQWSVIVVGLALGVPVVYGTPTVSEWMYVSLLFLLGAYGLFVYLQQGYRRTTAQCLLVALLVCELSAFHWSIRNVMQEQKRGADHLEQLRGLQEVAQFLRGQAGLFRVHLAVDWAPNLGDVFGIQTLGGTGVTVLAGYYRYRQVPRSGQLLNVRYIISNQEEGERTPVYRSGDWRVYETPFYYPRAWVVHQVVAEGSLEEVFRRIVREDFDPLRLAVVESPVALPLPPAHAVAGEAAVVRYRADVVELGVQTPQPGLLVVSEVDYPGWQATVNGQPSPIYRVNGLLRGVVVPAGDSRVVFGYAPGSIYLGAGVTCLAFMGTCGLAGAVAVSRRRRAGAQQPEQVVGL